MSVKRDGAATGEDIEDGAKSSDSDGLLRPDTPDDVPKGRNRNLVDAAQRRKKRRKQQSDEARVPDVPSHDPPDVPPGMTVNEPPRTEGASSDDPLGSAHSRKKRGKKSVSAPVGFSLPFQILS